MGIVIRQSFYSSLFSYLGAAIGFVNALILFPQFLEVDQIGLYRAILNAAALLLPFAQFGLHASLLKFFPETKMDESMRKQFLGFMLLGVCFFYSLFIAIYFIFRPEINSYFQQNAHELNDSFYLVLIMVFLLSFQTVIEAYSRSLLKTVFPNFLRDFFLRFLVSVSVLLFALNLFDFKTLLHSIIGIYLFVLLILIGYLRMDSQLKIALPRYSSFGAFGKRIINYSFFTFLGFTGSMIIVNIDSIMVSSMLGLSQNGIYVTAFYMGLIIELPRRSISQVTGPLLAKAFEEKNLGEVKSLYRKVSINQAVIGSLLFLGILVNLDNIFNLMPRTEIFSAGKYVVIFIALGKLIDMISSQNGEIILFSKYFRFNVVTTLILGILTVISNLLFIPIYGINGAAVASLISLSIFNVIKYVFVRNKLKMQPLSLNTLKVLISGTLTYFIISLIPDLPLWYDLVVRSLLVVIIFGGLTIITKASDEITDLVKGGWKQLF